jgi:lipid-binding SYLF domain-containing protein
MTQEALGRFQRGNNWTAGAEASVSVIRAGTNGKIDTVVFGHAVVVARDRVHAGPCRRLRLGERYDG